MKVLKIFVIVVLVFILILGIAIFIFIKSFDLDQYKDLITEHISESLHRQVVIEELKFKVTASKGIVLEAIDINIEDLLSMESAYLQVSVEKYLADREVHVSKVTLHKPNINVVMSELADLKAMAKGNEVSISEVNKKSDTKSKDLMSDLLIKDVSIREGIVHYVDDVSAQPLDIKITNLHASISDFSFNRSFSYTLKCSVFPEAKLSMKTAGKAIVYSGNEKVRLHDMEMEIILNKIPLQQVYRNVPDMAASGLEYISQGQLLLNIDQILMEKGAIHEITASGDLSEAQIHLKQIQSPIKIDAEFQADEVNAEILQYNVALADGYIKGKGKVDGYQSTQKFALEAQMEKINLRGLIDWSNAPMTIAGIVDGNISMQGRGWDEVALTNNLTGKGQFAIQEGKLVDYNLLKTVLDQLSVFPNFVDDLRTNLSQAYQGRLDETDTLLNEVSLTVQIAAGRVVMDDVKVNADGFVYAAKGDMDLQQKADIESSFYIAEDLSSSMIKTEEELTALLDEYKQIHIPFQRYKGPLMKYKPLPDIVDLLKQSMRNRGEDELRKALRKAFDIEEEPKQEENTMDTDQPLTDKTDKQDVSTEEVLIETLIETLPIFK